MEIERMNQQPNERDTNTALPPNSPESKALAAVITYANGLLATAESNQKEIERLLEILKQTEERRQAADEASSVRWKTQNAAQARAFDQQMLMMGKATQSVAAHASGGAKDGVNQALAEVKQQALGTFNQAVKPNLSELKNAVEDIHEARDGFKKAARYLTWKVVGLYALVALLPLLASIGWERHLVQKIEDEQTTVNMLDAKGGKAKLTTCDNRLCVEIDPKAGIFNIAGQGDYRIIKGY